MSVLEMSTCFHVKYYTDAAERSHTPPNVPRHIMPTCQRVRDSVMVEALCYKPEGRGFKKR
jgi:hypothetical protein